MDSTSTEATSNETAQVAVTWNDVAQASKEQMKVPRRERVTDTIEVQLDEGDLADIARANAADDDENGGLQRELEELRSRMKEKKTAIQAIEQRVRERNLAVRKGTQTRKAEWIFEEVFENNSVRYLDPITEKCVLERPMTAAERQTELALDTVAKTIAEGASKQLSLGDVPAADVEPAPNDDTSVTDPTALLEAAQTGSESEDDFNDFADDEDEDEDLEEEDDGDGDDE